MAFALFLFPLLIFADAQVVEELPQPADERICIDRLAIRSKLARYLFVPLSVGQQPTLQFINRNRRIFL